MLKTQIHLSPPSEPCSTIRSVALYVHQTGCDSEPTLARGRDNGDDTTCDCADNGELD